MRELKRIELAKLMRDSLQPRTDFVEAELLALGKNMLAIGQQVPLIVYPEGDKFVVADGECRLRGGSMVGMTIFDCMVLDSKPSAAELVALQLALDIHRKSLSAMERSNAFKRYMDETGDTLTKAAERLGINQPLASKLIGFQRLCDAAKEMLNAGRLDMEKAGVIAQEPDHTKQMELLQEAGNLTRPQLRRKARGVEQRAHKAVFSLPHGLMVVVQGKQMTLDDAVQTLVTLIKKLRQALREKLDITTATRVLQDRARAQP